MFARARFEVLGAVCAVVALASPAWAAKPRAPVADGGALPALATVVSHTGTRAVVEGKNVDSFLPRMPLICFESVDGRPGLQLFEATVSSVVGHAGSLEIADSQANRVQTGAVCEPRFAAEARAYRATLPKPAEAGKPVSESTLPPPPEPPKPRVRHRPPSSAQYGKPIWLEAVLIGPADKLFCYWRMGDNGSYTEQAMEPKADGLHTATLVLTQSDPPPRQVQYYLIAQGPAGRFAVFADPSDPHNVQLDAVPEVQNEQLVAHAPVDRATHHKALEILAEINKRFTKPTLYYRARGSGTYLAVPMQPLGAEQFRAEIPARDVVAPGLAYYIAVMDEKGIVREGYASPRSPQTVAVMQPQILSAESNRNRLTFVYDRADHGQVQDHYQHFDGGLDRLFFGFLVARLSAAAWLGEIPSGATAPGLRLFLGRAGIDLNLGDYVGISADLDMGSFKSGAGLGYRASARVGDEHVASIEIGIEQIWDIDAGNQMFDIKRGTLRIPFGDDWRLMAVAAQERILTDAPKAIRLGGGVELDLGSHLTLAVSGGVAGRRDQLGFSMQTGVGVRF